MVLFLFAVLLSQAVSGYLMAAQLRRDLGANPSPNPNTNPTLGAQGPLNTAAQLWQRARGGQEEEEEDPGAQGVFGGSHGFTILRGDEDEGDKDGGGEGPLRSLKVRVVMVRAGVRYSPSPSPKIFLLRDIRLPYLTFFSP